MLLPNFDDLHILVLGDVMIDRYQYGKVTRISPEAPIPVVELQQAEDRLGGAANVALNLLALGAHVSIISLSGNDDESNNLEVLYNRYPQIDYRLIKDPTRKTTVKTRILAQNQHLLRIDHESTHDVSEAVGNNIIEVLTNQIKTAKVDAIILQDYNKGFLTAPLISEIITMSNAKDIPTFVDPKIKNFFAYKGCTVIKPNKKEIIEACSSIAGNIKSNNLPEIQALEKAMRHELNNTVSFVTLGSEGIYTATSTDNGLYTTSPRNIADVCGAGDTVLSILTLCYLKKMPLSIIAQICNAGGGQVCEKPGVVQIDRKSLAKEILKSNNFKKKGLKIELFEKIL